MPEDSLIEAGHELRTAIEQVIDHAVDYQETENDEVAQGDWAKSQTYAVLLASLQSYMKAQLHYDQMLIEKVRAH